MQEHLHKVSTECKKAMALTSFHPYPQNHGLLRLEKTLCKPLAQQHIRSFPLDKGDGSSYSSEQVLTVPAPRKGTAARN